MSFVKDEIMMVFICHIRLNEGCETKTNFIYVIWFNKNVSFININFNKLIHTIHIPIYTHKTNKI